MAGSSIENAWPSPDADTRSRGVVMEGPVFNRRARRVSVLFRYEVRCWRDGVIPDAGDAVASPQQLSDDPLVAQRLLSVVASVPAVIWGRDELGTGEMWNSNSVIAWLITRIGLPAESIEPPPGGRAPGWKEGIAMARLQGQADEPAGSDSETETRVPDAIKDSVQTSRSPRLGAS